MIQFGEIGRGQLQAVDGTRSFPNEQRPTFRIERDVGARDVIAKARYVSALMAGNTYSPADALLAYEFPLIPGLIYVNHAAVAPWPRRTASAVKQFAEENMREGAAHYDRWLRTERAVRAQAATLINAPSADDIALLKNTSEALSVVAHGFPWQAGDNVIISNQEFPSNRIVWESLKRYGVAVREVALHGADPEQALIDAADARTRLLSISSVQYASGLRLDLERLGAVCDTRGIALCVDAIQSLGAVPHDVQGSHIDFLMADGHKWLLGPEGVAIFYCRGEWQKRLTLHEYGWHMVAAVGDYDRRDWEPAPNARRFECGSSNMLGIHGLSASLSLLLELGAVEIERRVRERAEHLFAAIHRRPYLQLVTSAAAGRYAGIVSFKHRTIGNALVYERLRAHGVICAQRGDAVRFSPHCYTPLDQLDAALELVPAAP